MDSILLSDILPNGNVDINKQKSKIKLIKLSKIFTKGIEKSKKAISRIINESGNRKDKIGIKKKLERKEIKIIFLKKTNKIIKLPQNAEKFKRDKWKI